MPDIRETRRRFTIAVALLAFLCVAAVAVLISPIGRGARSGERQIADLQHTLGTKTREVAPLAGIDKKVDLAKGQIDKFYKDRLPDSFSSISAELGRLAEANQVKFSTGRYQAETSDTPGGLTRVTFDAAIAGEYINTVKFINALERDRMFFLIDGVTLGQNQGGAVQLQIRVQTYMKTV